MALRLPGVPCVTTLDSNGNGEAEFTARGDVKVEHTRLSVSSAVVQPTAVLFLNGREFEGSYSGANDQSDTQHLMVAGDILTCVWTGGDPGARATMTIRGWQYEAGEGAKVVGG